MKVHNLVNSTVHTMAELSADVVKARSGQFDLESVQRVSLARMALGKVAVLQRCTSLVSLDLRGNMLTSCTQLGSLPKLKTLDLASNRVSTLDGVQALTNLEQLCLEGNSISDIKELDKLAPLVHLRCLSFRTPDGKRSNPVCAHPSYFTAIQKLLGPHKLQQVDGENLLLRDAAQKLMLENAEVDESEVKLDPTEPWAEPRHFRFTPARTSQEVIALEGDLSSAREEAKSLDAQAGILLSRAKAEAVAARKKAQDRLAAELAEKAARDRDGDEGGAGGGGASSGGGKQRQRK